MSSVRTVDGLLERWRKGIASIEEVRDLARELGLRPIESAASILQRLASHDDAIVRYNAILSLGLYLREKPCTPELHKAMLSDADEDVRAAAANDLGIIWAGTKDCHIGEALASAALNDEDEDVRKSAYEALIVIDGVTSDEYHRLIMGSERVVNPGQIAEMLERFRSNS